ncbi:hypothetical protein HNV12_03135 [Methanococcoides sp. SA1]|nr:hypothetical protein [Methanococcoides sp. SA1]
MSNIPQQGKIIGYANPLQDIMAVPVSKKTLAKEDKDCMARFLENIKN